MQDSNTFSIHITHKTLNNSLSKNNSQNGVNNQKFMDGLRNARNILNKLESSLQKTKNYERQLMKCRASHSHSHDLNDWWESDMSEEKSKCSKAGTAKSSRSQVVNLAESWSTMSIVCLQYQYDELSKRYSSLLQAYDERGSTLSGREAALSRLRQRVRTTHSRLAHAHRTLLVIGEKYLAMREKRLSQIVIKNQQKSEYEAKIRCLNRAVCAVLVGAERARTELDAQLAESMCVEQDAATALLLDEIRKCNLLFMENLKLKAQLEKLAPGIVNWDFL